MHYHSMADRLQLIKDRYVAGALPWSIACIRLLFVLRAFTCVTVLCFCCSTAEFSPRSSSVSLWYLEVITWKHCVLWREFLCCYSKLRSLYTYYKYHQYWLNYKERNRWKILRFQRTFLFLLSFFLLSIFASPLGRDVHLLHAQVLAVRML
jgi:hypothetical protein